MNNSNINLSKVNKDEQATPLGVRTRLRPLGHSRPRINVHPSATIMLPNLFRKPSISRLSCECC
jgi:hypothetical protein